MSTNPETLRFDIPERDVQGACTFKKGIPHAAHNPFVCWLRRLQTKQACRIGNPENSMRTSAALSHIERSESSIEDAQQVRREQIITSVTMEFIAAPKTFCNSRVRRATSEEILRARAQIWRESTMHRLTLHTEWWVDDRYSIRVSQHRRVVAVKPCSLYYGIVLQQGTAH